MTKMKNILSKNFNLIDEDYKSFILFIFFIALISIFSIEKLDAKTSKKVKSCCSTEMSEKAKALNDSSFYQLRSKWKRQDNKIINLSQLQGKVQIVAMVYTSCTYACPQTISDLKKIELALKKEFEANLINFQIFTFDPDRDKSKVFIEFANVNNINLKWWSFYSSDKGSIREFAALLGIQFKKESNGDFSHSNIITILDKNGVVVYQLVGLNADNTIAIQKIKSLLE